MFTLDNIHAAHSKVKSGADFPQYVRDIKKLGVAHYIVYVSDVHVEYTSTDGQQLFSPAKFEVIRIAEVVNKELFIKELKSHQNGATDYPIFRKMAASCSVEKWEVSVDKMTCSYYSKAGEMILVEHIS